MNQKLFIVLFFCTTLVGPTIAISRWFSATYNDLKFTLYRFSHCYNGLQPLNGPNMNESEYLVHQIKTFLDQANYDNEQLANVSALMDSICRSSIDSNYAVSLHINVTKFSNSDVSGKDNRCNAIDDAMDSMYYVFRRAALNHSEPLDFSIIQFYPNETDRSATYNLTDLINVSWIKSETTLDTVCSITSATKDYIFARSSSSSAQARAEPQLGPMGTLVELLNRMLDPILGLQKRLYWEGTNRLGQIQSRLSSGLGNIRGGIGYGLDRTRQRLFGSRVGVNGTSPTIFNSTSSNVTQSFGSYSSTPALNKTSTSMSVSTSSGSTRQMPTVASNFSNFINSTN